MTLNKRCMDAYWAQDNDFYTIAAPERMRDVLRLVAEEVAGWAPSPTAAKITHLQFMEISRRLKELADG